MKNLLTALIFSSIITFSSNLCYAAEPKAKSTSENPEIKKDDAKVKKPKFIYDKKTCDIAAANINDDIKSHTSCWKDEDCKMLDFGYPWQNNACIKTIISLDQKEKIIAELARTQTYREACIDTNKDEKKKYDDLQKKIAKSNCAPVPLLCLRGVCRTSTYAVIDANDTNKLKIDAANLNESQLKPGMFSDETLGKGK